MLCKLLFSNEIGEIINVYYVMLRDISIGYASSDDEHCRSLPLSFRRGAFFKEEKQRMKKLAFCSQRNSAVMRTVTRNGVPLLFLFVFLSGCTTTLVTTNESDRRDFNDEVKGGTAEITLHSGQEMELEQFRVGPDSSIGINQHNRTVGLANHQIEEVAIINRGRAAKSGLLWGGAFTLVNMGLHFGDFGSWGSVSFNFLAAYSAGTTALMTGVAALIGQVGEYKFKAPPASRNPQPQPEEEQRVVAQKERTVSSTSTTEEAQEKGEETEKEERASTSIVDTQIPKTSMTRPDDIAVVIGNTEYENSDIPNVDYAVRDAQIMKRYLTRTLGFRKENVIYMENASAANLTRIFGTEDDPEGQLYDWVKPNQSSVFVYYSGHGAPNPETGNAYLLPSDANPSYLSQNGYPLTQLYENLSKIPAQSVTVAMEACFSGTSEGGTVVQNASPAVLSVENPVMGMENGLAMTAGATDQVASWYPEKKHGLFTYYFLKGLRGNADANDDNEVTAKEMESYLSDKVPYRAQRMHSRKQTPQVVGQNKDQVLVEYESEVPAN